MFLLAILLGSITFGVSGSAQALDTLSRSAPVGHASKRVELPDIQDAPKFGTVDVGALALRLRASSESAIRASQASIRRGQRASIRRGQRASIRRGQRASIRRG